VCLIKRHKRCHLLLLNYLRGSINDDARVNRCHDKLVYVPHVTVGVQRQWQLDGPLIPPPSSEPERLVVGADSNIWAGLKPQVHYGISGEVHVDISTISITKVAIPENHAQVPNATVLGWVCHGCSKIVGSVPIHLSLHSTKRHDDLRILNIHRSVHYPSSLNGHTYCSGGGVIEWKLRIWGQNTKDV